MIVRGASSWVCLPFSFYYLMAQSKAMISVVRLYLEPRPEIPEHQRPITYSKVVDVLPHEVRATRRRLRRQGFTVIAVPL